MVDTGGNGAEGPTGGRAMRIRGRGLLGALAVGVAAAAVVATAPAASLSLSARPEKPYVLHGGGTGFIQQSLGGSSAYYSATRMAARGAFTTHGHRITFTGEAWLDHQWGSFQKDPRAFNWDWFSC